jgi:hypothetical protein
MQDSGNYQDVTIDDIHAAARDHGTLDFLKQVAKDNLDLSVHLKTDVYGDFRTYFEEKFYQIAGGLEGRERRKTGVENSGICFAIAVIIEMIQQGDDLHW